MAGSAEFLLRLRNWSYFSRDEITSPVVQGFLTDPETPVDQIAVTLIRTPHTVPDSFATHQFCRIFYPETLQDFQARGLQNPYGEYRYGLAEMMLDLRHAMARDQKLLMQGNRDAEQRLQSFRGALMRLNGLVVANQDPETFNWASFSPKEPVK